MLTRVRITNYRSLADVSVDLERFTVLIGANASGKTNFVDALGLLADSLSDELETAVLRRGGREALLWQGSASGSFTLSLDYRPDANVAPTTYEVTVGFDADRRPIVQHEKILLKRIRNEMRGRRRRALDAHNGRGTAFDEALEAPREFTGDPHMLQVASLGVFEDQPQVKEMRDFVAGWRFLRVDVEAIRRPQLFQRSEDLASSAANLGVVLNTIKTDHEAAFRWVNTTLGAVIPGEPEVVPQVLGGNVILTFTSPQFPGHEFPATSVSDGTLRFLAYITALEVHPPPSLLVLEEPEHGLHPDATSGLVEILVNTAEERDIQTLVTTHSGDVLDAVPSHKAVRVVERQDDGSTRIGPITELDDLNRWLKDFRLSELWRSNAIGANP